MWKAMILCYQTDASKYFCILFTGDYFQSLNDFLHSPVNHVTLWRTTIGKKKNTATNYDITVGRDSKEIVSPLHIASIYTDEKNS